MTPLLHGITVGVISVAPAPVPDGLGGLGGPMRYVTITYRGQYFIVRRDRGVLQVRVDGTGIGSDTIFKRIELGDNTVAFRTLAGGYLTAVPPEPPLSYDYAWLGVAFDEVGPAQTFLEVWLPNDRVGLRTNLGTFVCAENDGKGGLVVNRSEMGEWEKFFYVKPPDELLPREEEDQLDVKPSVQDARTKIDSPAAEGLRGKIFGPLQR